MLQPQHNYRQHVLQSAAHALKASSADNCSVSMLLLHSQLHPENSLQGLQHSMVCRPLFSPAAEKSGSGSAASMRSSSESCASHMHSPSVQVSTAQAMPTPSTSAWASTVHDAFAQSPPPAWASTVQDACAQSPPPAWGSTVQDSSAQHRAPCSSPAHVQDVRTASAQAAAGGVSRQNRSSSYAGSEASALLHSLRSALSKGGRSSTNRYLSQASTGRCMSDKDALKGLLMEALARQQQQQQQPTLHHQQQPDDACDIRQRLVSVLRCAQGQHDSVLRPHHQQQLSAGAGFQGIPAPNASREHSPLAAAAATNSSSSAVAAANLLLDVVAAKASAMLASSMRQRLVQELRALSEDAAAAGLLFDLDTEVRHMLPQLQAAAAAAVRMASTAAVPGSVGAAAAAAAQQSSMGGLQSAPCGQFAAAAAAAAASSDVELAAMIEAALLAAAQASPSSSGGSPRGNLAAAGPAAATAAGNWAGPAVGNGQSQTGNTSRQQRLSAPGSTPQQQQQPLTGNEVDDFLIGSSKRQRTATGCSGRQVQAASPNTSAGLMPSAAIAAPSCPAVSVGPGALRLSPPPSGAVGSGVKGLVPAQGTCDGGFGVDYIEQLLQQELTAAMLEELGGFTSGYVLPSLRISFLLLASRVCHGLPAAGSATAVHASWLRQEA